MKNAWSSLKKVVYVAIILCGIGLNLGLEYSDSSGGLSLKDLNQQIFAVGGETKCYGGGGDLSYPQCQPGCHYALMDDHIGTCTF